MQCGAILPSSVRACSFCDSSLNSETLNLSVSASGSTSGDRASDTAWRGEVAQRLEAYRTKRRKSSVNANQSKLPFEAAAPLAAPQAATALAEKSAHPEEDFSFTIAIGRTANKREDDTRMVIDVSLPLGSERASPKQARGVAQESGLNPSLNTGVEQGLSPGLYPVASIEERRLAALADGACLLFAYGAFLALFGSVGGQFTLSKLSAAVCSATFALVYLQYFALFTIFGGTTPGMMLRGLQVVSFSGETPTPRQMLLRSAGYMLSAGTFFMGFLWAMWDEDALTWHDRMSHTYLCTAQTYADLEASTAAHSR